MCGIKSFEDLRFDSPARGHLEAVIAGPDANCFQLLSGSTRPRYSDRTRSFRAGLAGRGDLLRGLDIWSERRLDLVGVSGSKINPIVKSLIGEGNFVSQSSIDRLSVEIIDELANKYFGHSEPSSLNAG